MQELFCGFYETASTTSEELFKIVKDVLFKFQLPIDKCRDLCYDNAACCLRATITIMPAIR